ncbi:hypothetical protein QQ045_004501 [Rhodiola kirilowii]
MEKMEGAPAGLEYSEEVAAVLAKLFSISDDDVEMDQLGEEMVEKVMRELLDEMNGLGSAEVAIGEFMELNEATAASAAKESDETQKKLQK